MNFNDIITPSCGILGTGKLEQKPGRNLERYDVLFENCFELDSKSEGFFYHQAYVTCLEGYMFDSFNHL